MLKLLIPQIFLVSGEESQKKMGPTSKQKVPSPSDLWNLCALQRSEKNLIIPANNFINFYYLL